MSTNSQPSDDQSQPSVGQSEASNAATARRGLLLGLGSAVGYSAANLALRGLSGEHEDLAWAIWVSGMKAVPTVTLALLLLSRRKLRGETLYATIKPIPALIAAGLLMHFGGNLGFQLALGHVGLAITVPLVFAFIISAGAILGRVFVGDTVSRRTVVSIGVMMVSIILLSYAATASDDSSEQASGYAGGVAWMGLMFATISGLAYGINGVILRRVTRQVLPVESVLLVYSATGLICLSAIGGVMLGTERLLSISQEQWLMMLCAGTFNALAFFAITNALKLINITQVNVINATQNAMCAVGAVMIFAEPMSVAMVVGIVLSIVGLVLLDRK